MQEVDTNEKTGVAAAIKGIANSNANPQKEKRPAPEPVRMVATPPVKFTYRFGKRVCHRLNLAEVSVVVHQLVFQISSLSILFLAPPEFCCRIPFPIYVLKNISWGVGLVRNRLLRYFPVFLVVNYLVYTVRFTLVGCVQNFLLKQNRFFVLKAPFAMSPLQYFLNKSLSPPVTAMIAAATS